ncbi:DNA mismatch repair protein MutS, partial [Paenibacillus sepulcri]|nr:DNA mismatch repair protein MutS [Paenibacillus sepulcri]
RGTSTGEGMSIAQAVIEYVHHEIGCKALVSTHFHELAHLEDTLPLLRNVCMAVQETGDNVTFLRKLVPGAASSSYGIYCAQLAGLPERIISRAYTLLASHADEAIRLPVLEALVDPPGRAAVIDAVRETASSYAPAVDAPAGSDMSTVSAGADRSVEESEKAQQSTDDHQADSQSGSTLSPDKSSEVVQLSIFEDSAALQTRTRKTSPKAEQVAEQLRKLDLFNITPMQAMQLLNEMKMKLVAEK